MNRTQQLQLQKHLKQSLHKLSCDYIKSNKLYPIQGDIALKLFIECILNLNKECSIKHLVQFINYLKFDDFKGENLSNYIKTTYYLVKFLIELEEWKTLTNIKCIILPEFITSSQGVGMSLAQSQQYTACKQFITRGVYDSTNIETMEDTLSDLLKMIIEMEQKLGNVGLLQRLKMLTISFKRKQYIPKFGLFTIRAVIVSQVHLLPKDNFTLLMDIMRICFINATNKEIQDAVQQLQKYVATSKSKIQPVVDYLESVIVLLHDPETIILDPNILGRPLHQLNKIHKQASFTHYIEEIVFFCYEKLKYCNNKKSGTKDIEFTPEVQKALQIYISHAKSQAIMIKDKFLPKKCCCRITKHIHTAIQLHYGAFNFTVSILETIKDQATIGDEFYMVLYNLSLKSFELLEVSAKEKCQEVGRMWTMLGIQLHNLAICLMKYKRHSVNIKFLELLTKNIFIYGNFTADEKCAKTVLYYFADCLVAFKRWDHALDMCAMSIHMYPAHRDAISRIWNLVHYNCNSNVSICEVLERKSEFLTSICGSKLTQLNNKDKEKSELYIYEITNYVAKYKSMARIEHCLENLFMLITPDEFVKFLISLPFSIVNKLKFPYLNTKWTFSNTLHSGIHQYLLYKMKYLKAINDFDCLPKNEYNEKPKVLPQETSEMVNQEEPKLIAQNYQHIRIDQHDAFFTHLKESLIALNNTSEPVALVDYNETVLELVVNMAHEFELHCYAREARRAWYLALRIAQKLNNENMIVHSITFLLKCEDTNVSELIILSNHQLDLKDEEGNEKVDCYTKFTWFAALTVYYLKTDKLDGFRLAYQNTRSIFGDFNDLYHANKNELMNYEKGIAAGYYALMLSVVELLPCAKVQDEIHGTDMLQLQLRIWRILRMLIGHSKTTTQYSQFLSLFFTLTEDIVWKYSSSGFIIEAYGYAKCIVTLAENALLTYRVCRMLVRMGNFDIARLKINNCQVKILGLNEILNINAHDDDNDEAVAAPLVLINSSSPIALTKFTMPSFVNHENCTCLLCTTWEYQSILIEKFHIEAQVAEYYNDTATASSYLKGIFKMYQLLMKCKQFYQPDTLMNMLWTSIGINLKVGNMSHVEKNIKILLAQLEKRQFKNYFLYNEVRNLQLAIHVSNLSNKAKKDKSPMAKSITPEIKVEEASPVLITPKPKLQLVNSITVSEKKSERSHELLVPETENRRTRLRGKNLFVDFENNVSTSTPQAHNTPTTSTTKKSKSKSTLSRTVRSRKGMR